MNYIHDNKEYSNIITKIFEKNGLKIDEVSSERCGCPVGVITVDDLEFIFNSSRGRILLTASDKNDTLYWNILGVNTYLDLRCVIQSKLDETVSKFIETALGTISTHRYLIATHTDEHYISKHFYIPSFWSTISIGLLEPGTVLCNEDYEMYHLLDSQYKIPRYELFDIPRLFNQYNDDGISSVSIKTIKHPIAYEANVNNITLHTHFNTNPTTISADIEVVVVSEYIITLNGNRCSVFYRTSGNPAIWQYCDMVQLYFMDMGGYHNSVRRLVSVLNGLIREQKKPFNTSFSICKLIEFRDIYKTRNPLVPVPDLNVGQYDVDDGVSITGKYRVKYVIELGYQIYSCDDCRVLNLATKDPMEATKVLNEILPRFTLSKEDCEEIIEAVSRNGLINHTHRHHGFEFIQPFFGKGSKFHRISLSTNDINMVEVTVFPLDHTSRKTITCHELEDISLKRFILDYIESLSKDINAS